MEKFVIQLKIGDKWKTVEKPKDHQSAEALFDKVCEKLEDLGAEDVRLMNGFLDANSKKTIWKVINRKNDKKIRKKAEYNKKEKNSKIDKNLDNIPVEKTNRRVSEKYKKTRNNKTRIIGAVSASVLFLFLVASIVFQKNDSFDDFLSNFTSNENSEYTVLLDRFESIVEIYESAPSGMNQMDLIEFMSDVAIEMTKLERDMRPVKKAIEQKNLNVSQSQAERYIRLNQRLSAAMMNLRQ